ncbi:unnamed protein product [Rotaria sp. Silwood1]|nr:unnamed protein product [Rotaria sp. Silwood1]
MYKDNIEKLPINRTAKDMADFVLSINPFSGKKSCQSCDNCSENNAVNWCDVCAVHYCESCTQSIHSIKALQSHNIVPLTEKVYSICSEHPDDKFKYCCSKCEVLVCRDCLLFKHRDHTFMSLKDAAIEAKIKFQAIGQEIDKMKKNLTKVLDETKSVTNQQIQIVQEQKQDIEQTFVTLQRILEERKCTIIQELDNNELQMTNLLAQQQRDIDQYLNFTIVQELCVKRMLNSNDPMQILKLKSTLSQNANDFVVQYKKIGEDYTIMRQVF